MNSLLRYNPKTVKLLLAVLTLMPTLTIASNTEVIKDPTLPLFNLEHGLPMAQTSGEEKEEEEVPLFLQGIVNKSGKKFAVINDKVLSKGQLIEGYEIIEIKDYEVELKGKKEGETEQLLLTLHKVNIKNSND